MVDAGSASGNLVVWPVGESSISHPPPWTVVCKGVKGRGVGTGCETATGCDGWMLKMVVEVSE